jgi:integrase
MWCAGTRINPSELAAPNVMRYLQSRPLSRATKQARLTYPRRLVQTLYSADTSNALLETYVVQLKLMRLDGSQVHELIAGLRRFEAVKLKWSDIDFEQEHIKVMGGKARQRGAVDYVSFLGSLVRHL